MALRIASLGLLFSMLLQNLSELSGGGPIIPMQLAPILPDHPRPGAALVTITVVLVAMILPAVLGSTRPARFVVALAAGGLAFNALTQLAASAFAGTLLPGTLTGVVLMLPAALAVLWLSGRQALGPALLGVILSPVILVATWHIAALLP